MQIVRDIFNHSSVGVLLQTFLPPTRSNDAKTIHAMSNERSTRPSLTLVLNAILLTGLVVAFGIFARAEMSIDRINEQWQASFALAEDLRRSSNDLTDMVRTYLMTGNPVFKTYYQEILGIRDGTRPRPEHYSAIDWDLVVSEQLPSITAAGKPIALLDLARQTVGTDAEFRTLAEAKTNSDRLTATEVAAMNLMESAETDGEAERAQARLMVFDARYRQAKGEIMRPIHAFLTLVYQRTHAEIRAAKERSIQFLGVFMVCGLGLLFMFWRTYRAHQATTDKLRASERRYRDLSANLEREVEARTAEVRVAYDALRQSEERYRLLADNSRDVIWTMALDGRITYVSPAVEPLRGLTPDEAMRQSIDEILTPASQAIVLDYFGHLQAALEAGRPPESFNGELEYWRKDGTTFWTDVTALPILTSDGHPVEILGVTRDISARKANELKIRRMLENIPTAIAALSMEQDVRVLFINEQFVRTFGYTQEEIPTLGAWEALAYPETDYRNLANAWWRRATEEAVRATGKVESREVHITCKDGRVKEVMVSATTMDDMLLVALLDITERRRAEERLRLSEERHRLWADHSIDGIWTMGLDGVFTYLSPSLERMMGYTATECMALPLEAIMTQESFAVVADGLSRAVANVQAGLPIDFTARELEHVRQDGSRFWAEVTATGMYDRDGRFLEIIGVTRDISARKQNERELERAREATAAANQALEAANAELLKLASTDALTGAWNRRHFEQAVDAAITQARRYRQPLSLILFDIDHFKLINDRYGHQTGDLVLIEVARRVREGLRVSDLLARWGGEEFVILTPHCGEAEAAELAERVRGLLADDAFPEVGRVTSSFGVAEWARDETQDAWLKRVDQALYRAKEEGRNRVMAGGAMPLTKTLDPLGLTWRDAYACGEPAIDDEHRELFRLCNDLLRTAAAEPAVETLLRVWDTLLSHTVEHFAHEEAILQRRGYPELEHHAESHRHLIARAMELRGQVEQRGGDFGLVVKFLYRDLVVLHLLNEDRAFFPLFASQRQCSRPPRPMET